MKRSVFSAICWLALWSTAMIGFSNAAAAPAGPDAPNYNFERTGIAAQPDGLADPIAYSKLAPWPRTDGKMLYSGCQDSPTRIVTDPADDRCFVTIDATDPDRPKRVARVPAFDPVASPPPPSGHAIWKRDYPYPGLPAKAPCRVDWNDPDIAAARKPAPCWDPGWNTHTHYVARGPGKLLAVNQERYRFGTDRQQSYRGVKFYDVADPAHPRFLSYWEAPTLPANLKTGAYPDMGGVHHFNFGGRYLYLGTEYAGYVGKVLVILDLADPRHPREISHWAVPGQKTPEQDAQRDWDQVESFSMPVVRMPDGKWRKHVGMHYVTVYENTAFLSYHQAGLVILDVKDKAHPRLLSTTNYLLPGADPDTPDAAACRAAAGGADAACGNAHSAKLVPGRPGLLVMTDEYFTCPYGMMRLVDVHDLTHPKILSHFALPENTMCKPDTPNRSVFPYLGRGPSTHIANALNADIQLVAWYGAGLRAVDISDPLHPREVGRYQYDFAADYPGATGRHGEETYDVIIGAAGRLYVADGTAGLRVMRYTGPTAGRATR